MQPHFAILEHCHVLVAISADGSQRAQGKDHGIHLESFDMRMFSSQAPQNEAELQSIKEERSCKGSASCVQKYLHIMT